MWTLLLVIVTLGSSAPVQGHDGRCSFAGVLHVEGISSYSLTFQNALELCQSLSYKLATEEQVIESYKKGLRTCRYGWIDGQNVAFLPYSNSPNCDSRSKEVTFHSEAAEHMSDVYCFNPADALDRNCENVVKPVFQLSNDGNLLATVDKQNEDILEEALIEGFLVNLGKTDSNVQNVPEAAMDLVFFTLPKSVSSFEELNTGTDTQDVNGSSNKFRFKRNLNTEEEGSGSGFNPIFGTTEPNQVTTRSSVMEPTQKKDEVISPIKGFKQDTILGGRARKNPDSPSTPTAHWRKGSPTWLVVLATCVVVGAILCVFAAIATKDKWYGPRQKKNIATEDYSKAATLPLSEKEQEIVILMSAATVPNGKTEDKVVNLDEREREYLM